ncbi:CGNR zinc finger domain-containing protein [Kineosporia succinea]|uniref:RNA-binding Zn ribbon-like protein n=1 Tax=Kineosporia succinea TaxID=84632 RepID=A0ABT9NZB8_9ACTN|nr:CGNR zinc finger domain-containing protein [Kineosporia succinea]MDP9825783.1 putative RNA-binding Zn ribbon-like protein [Kineosporia succinea]
MPRFAATERLDTSVAPEDLLLTQELANSQGPPTYGIDLFDTPEPAQAWLDGLLEEYPGAPVIRLGPGEIERLRAIRASLHRLLARGDETLHSGAEPPLDAPVNLRAGPNGVEGSPVGTGVDWLASAVTLELFRAQEHDLLRRLKLCHNPGCTVIFYDRSKNNSRTWHDVATCGNRANVRAYRARRKASSS